MQMTHSFRGVFGLVNSAKTDGTHEGSIVTGGFQVGTVHLE